MSEERTITYRLRDAYKFKGMAEEIWHKFKTEDAQLNFEMMHPEYERVESKAEDK